MCSIDKYAVGIAALVLAACGDDDAPARSVERPRDAATSDRAASDGGARDDGAVASDAGPDATIDAEVDGGSPETGTATRVPLSVVCSDGCSTLAEFEMDFDCLPLDDAGVDDSASHGWWEDQG